METESKQMSMADAADKGLIELIYDGHHGIYCPQFVCQSYVFQADLDEDVEICVSGPDAEFYWEAWENILGRGVIVGESGKRWRIMQDGDVWAVREDAMDSIDWEA